VGFRFISGWKSRGLIVKCEIFGMEKRALIKDRLLPKFVDGIKNEVGGDRLRYFLAAFSLK
jgi:hypothetical protein